MSQDLARTPLTRWKMADLSINKTSSTNENSKQTTLLPRRLTSAMDEDLYDEFGNLIGDPQDSDAESAEYVFEAEGSANEEQAETQQQIVVHREERSLYPTMSETFGGDVETVVQLHDTQSIAEPLVKPNVKKLFKIEDKTLPKTTYSKEYLLQLLGVPHRVRNVALVGSLNSGKTSLLDMLILQTHELKVSKNSRNYKKLRYTDNTTLEVQRGITIKSSPMSLLLPNLKGNSTVLNIIDTPGHVDFADELAIAQRITDISVVVLDVVEGLTIGAKRAIDNALMNNIELAFVINKIDRLILELKLPPQDSYHKIRNNVDEVNTYLTENPHYETYQHQCTISPDLNNILFASADFNFCFNLRSFAKLYSERLGASLDIDAFAKRLWGNVYFDEVRNKFTTKGEKRSFIHFILEPIYKIVTQVLSHSSDELKTSIYETFGITLSKNLLKSDPQVLLKEIFRLVFGDSSGLVDVLETFSPPDKHTKTDFFTGTSQAIREAIALSSREGPLVANISKMVEDDLAMARVLSGTIKKGDEIRVLGESYDDGDEDSQIITVDQLFIPGGRYKIPVEEVPAGAICLIGGVSIVVKSGTVFGATVPEPLAIFKPIDYLIESVFKAVIEPQVPSELPRMYDGLQKMKKSYCGVEIKIEESGEYVVFGSGELYMDSLMFDLRNITDINIKISDPITKFSETIQDKSFTKVTIKSQNEKNSITIIAEPLEEALCIDLEKGKLQNQKRLNKVLREKYGWDSLAARSLWSFGSDSSVPNALLDDTLSDEVDKDMLNSMKESIIQGFEWAISEGPLADEPIRNVKFKIIDARFSRDLLQRDKAQIIPMVRRACFSAVLTSSPKLMEPVYNLEIISTSKTIGIIEDLLDKRRGAVLKDSPIPATQLYKIHGFVPVIDAIGLETDIRVATQGQALVSLYFAKWAVVPGDPLDEDVFIPRLKPAPIHGLARDFVMKTRKRKGSPGKPTLAKYIDKDLVEQLKELGLLT